MDDAFQSVTALADECQEFIRRNASPGADPPELIDINHLSWMLDQICLHAQDWPPTKLYLWIGFVQCGLIANGLLKPKTARAMFGQSWTGYSVDSIDQDLIDHLDHESSFSLDIGGES